MSILRVERTEDAIYIKRLSDPDAAGNRHFIVVVKLEPEDFIELATGAVSEAEYASDKQILDSLR